MNSRVPPEPPGQSPTASTRELLTLSLAFSMITAAGQLLRAAYVHRVQYSFAWMSRDALWMTPLAFLIIFSVVLGLQRALGAVIRPFSAIRWLAFTAVALCVVSLSLNLPFISPIAILVLAIGVASAIARWHATGSPAGIRTLFRVGAALASTFVILGAGERAIRATRGTNAGSHETSAGARAPNVLLLIWDTVRASNLSLYGYARRTTPVLEELANESTVFDFAISPSSWTLPSHAAMFTGHRAGSLGVDWRRPYDGRFQTLAQAFAASNYATSAFAANLSYTTWESGLNRGFDRFEDYRVSAKQMMWSANLLQIEMVRSLIRARSLREVRAAFAGHHLRVAPEPRNDQVRAEEVVRDFLEWQLEHRNRPFFAFLNFFDAHPPIALPPPFQTRFGNSPTDLDLYDGAIQYMDAQVDVLVDSLRARGELDRTVLVIASDHGEQFGEHGLIGHGNSLYAQLTRVPLLLRYPARVRGGTRVASPVSLTNLPATLVQIAGIRDTTFPGSALVPMGDDSAKAPDPILVEVGPLDNHLRDKAPNARGPLQSVIDSGRKYIRRHDGREELFDVAADPAEAFNLAADATRQADLVRLRTLLASLLRADARGTRAMPPSRMPVAARP